MDLKKYLILGTQFPDVIASRNGEIIKIEFEYKLSNFSHHYFINLDEGYYGVYPRNQGWEWKYDPDRKYWHTFDLKKNMFYSFGPGYQDLDNQLITDKYGRLRYKTLKDQCDCVFCYIKDCKLIDNIEVIALNENINIDIDIFKEPLRNF